uniref:Uncharacterized protein n=1 Tax=Setaria viridis TaxID=4556 RepID=A0A4U6THH5_SETVI|nr:hypothetical protein SEVIR_8G203000v2 [Setaria viridis]
MPVKCIPIIPHAGSKLQMPFTPEGEAGAEQMTKSSVSPRMQRLNCSAMCFTRYPQPVSKQ